MIEGLEGREKIGGVPREEKTHDNNPGDPEAPPDGHRAILVRDSIGLQFLGISVPQ